MNTEILGKAQTVRELLKGVKYSIDYDQEVQSGFPPHDTDYVSDTGKQFVVSTLSATAHNWYDSHGGARRASRLADRATCSEQRHADEFGHPADFAKYRNRIGGLLLLPKSFNGSYGDLVYADKLPHYNTQNLLARSLHPLSYEHNPGFLRFIQESQLPFKPCAQFKKSDLEERGVLYQKLAERIWNPETLLRELA